MELTLERSQDKTSNTSADRRLHPRNHQGLTGHIVLADGKTLKLPLQNITLEKVQLGCDEKDIKRIQRDGWSALNGETVDVGFRVALPTDGRRTESFDATCRLMFSRRVTQKRYCIGLQLMDVEGVCRDILIRYLLDEA